MKKIVLFESDNYSEDYLQQFHIVEDDKYIRDIIDTLIIDECINIRVFELGNEITEKFDTENAD